jgi:two-component system osmolarity sensor histidine kinase EnvZ
MPTHFAPQSLLARFLLIILIPGVMIPVIMTYVFFERHWKNVTRHMTAALAGEVALVTKLSQYDNNIFSLQEVSDQLSFSFTWDERNKVPPIIIRKDNEFSELMTQLAMRIAYPVSVSYDNHDYDDIVIHVYFPDNRVLSLTTSHKRIENPTTQIFVSITIATAFILLVIAMLFSRNQIRAIIKLSDAAEAFGKGLDDGDFKPTGAKEVRQAGHAFVEMKERIKRQVDQRTAMLAGISHDLRTPLTRMKLQLAMMQNPEDANALQEDIEAMEHMVQEYLDFARGDSKEQPQATDLRTFLKKIISTYRHHEQDVTLHMERDVKLPLKPHAFTRCLHNLIDNGLSFGKKVDISVSLRDTEHHVTLMIEDDGPGIPETEYQNVFKPFYRIDGSRNADTGGAGLGMSIARDIITNHGGKVFLERASTGGLRVVLQLPL